MLTENGKEQLQKPHITIEFGLGGHENEYVIKNLPLGPYSDPTSIPADWESTFTEKLGKGWSVMNRGERLEIKPPLVGENRLTSQPERTKETDATVRSILYSLVGGNCELKFYP